MCVCVSVCVCVYVCVCVCVCVGVDMGACIHVVIVHCALHKRINTLQQITRKSTSYN